MISKIYYRYEKDKKNKWFYKRTQLHHIDAEPEKIIFPQVQHYPECVLQYHRNRSQGLNIRYQDCGFPHFHYDGVYPEKKCLCHSECTGHTG